MFKKLNPIQALRFIPQPLVIVTAGDPNDPKNRGGMTAAWASRVSWNPPLIMVSIAPSRNTLNFIRKFKCFVVNIVTPSLEEVAYNVFGSLSSRNVDKFSVAGITPKEAKTITAPVIPTASIVLECRVVNEVEAGDHIMVVGEVVDAYRMSDEKPLVHYIGMPWKITKSD
ncbi:MAG: flavin reductase family protein [Thermoproteales archaeon]|nr:flavin reductase family protein [Thermoproteales archaeon]